MTDQVRIALAQLNPKVGDFAGNVALARKAVADATATNADILVFSELFTTGYFPEDLLFRPQFVADAMEAAREIAAMSADTELSVLLPTVWRHGGVLRNAVLLAEHGEIVDIRFKVVLPNDDVFYEKRYFTPGELPDPLSIKGIAVGVPICEDIWHPEVPRHLRARGAELMLCPNGSPYWRDKQRLRYRLTRDRVGETGVPLVYLNQVGGQDELVFDGASFAVEPGGEIVAQAASFAEDFMVTEWRRGTAGWRAVPGPMAPLASEEGAPWSACVLGLRDYVRKNGFARVVLGLSGGIDSAVVAAMATDALGPENVHCLMLPYRYTSPESLRDAEDCARRLGVRYDVVAIGEAVEGANAALGPVFGNRPPDITEENIQSRMRGLLLMAVSNKLGSLLLTTGNKSEMAVGYATIYGDMNGGFNPIKDLLKTEVYALARWRNANVPPGGLGPSGAVIPEAILTKPPTAELRPGQTDQDSLPPYAVLDEILAMMVEEEVPIAEIVARGQGRYDLALVKRVERLVYLAEYKRRQAAPGVKVTRKAFGLGRKYPITNGYRDESGAAGPGATVVRIASQGVE